MYEFSINSNLLSLVKYLTALLCMFGHVNAVAQINATPFEQQNKTTYQLGVDAWQMHTPNKASIPLKGVDNLFLANGNTQWEFKNTAPWIKVDGTWQVTHAISLKYKARSDQSVGNKVDDLHVDLAISPSFGFRAGVVDYKTSWCRTYDVDSPWMRENDPFCTTKTTNAATLSAPGLQTYLIFRPSNYQVQSIIGIYRPMAFNYNTTEFSNVSNTKGVAVNNRWGWSINALNQDTGSEFRLSWLGAKQENNRDPYGYRDQTAGMWYLGTSIYPLESINIRAYILNSHVAQRSLSEPPDYMQILDTDMLRESRAIEMVYQINPQNSMAIGTSRYRHLWNLTGLNGYEAYTDPNYVRFFQKSTSISWRKEWSHGVYSVVQWTTSSNDQLANRIPAKAQGEAFGLRLGFTY